METNSQSRFTVFIRKVSNVFREKGLLFSLKHAVKTGSLMLWNLIRYSFQHRSYARYIRQLPFCDRVFLWKENFGWNIALFQRPQHIARSLAKKGNTVFYYTSPEFDKDITDIHQIEPNLYLVNRKNPVLLSMLERHLNQLSRHKYLHTYSTLGTPADELQMYERHGFHVLYEYVDDLAPELLRAQSASERLLQKFDYVTQDNHIPIAVTADLLKEQIVSRRGDKNLVQSSNGVDAPHFRTIRNDFVFSDAFQTVLNRGNKIVGYYGAMAQWMDYDLLKAVAQKLPGIDFVLIGKKYDDSYDVSGLDALANVHFIGPVAYQDLPQYASRFDLCTIPFKVNSITNATSPLKLFEYMAMGKPVLTTAMKESSKYAAVNLATGAEEFADKILQLLEYTPETQPAYFALLEKTVEENSWDAKTDLILAMLSRFETA